MSTNGVVASPENEVILAPVLLNLEVVDFTVTAVWSPYQAAPVHTNDSAYSPCIVTFSVHLLSIHDVETGIRLIPSGRNKDITSVVTLRFVKGLHEIDMGRHHIARLKLLHHIAPVFSLIIFIIVVKRSFVRGALRYREEQTGKRE